MLTYQWGTVPPEAFSQEMLQISTLEMSLTITNSREHLYLPEAKQLKDNSMNVAKQQHA